MYDISLRLLCANKPGTLSRTIRQMKIIGMRYQRHQIKKQGENVIITIDSVGEITSRLVDLKELFENSSNVLKMLELNVFKDGVKITNFKTTISESLIAVNEALTPAVILSAESRLSEILGPASSYIIEMTAVEYDNAGDFFRRLAEELNDEQERAEFLSILKD